MCAPLRCDVMTSFNGRKYIIGIAQAITRIIKRIGPDKGGHWEVIE